MITDLGVAEAAFGVRNIKPETKPHGDMPSLRSCTHSESTRDSITSISGSKSKLDLYLGFFKFLPIGNRFAKNCWFESNRLMKLLYSN